MRHGHAVMRRLQHDRCVGQVSAPDQVQRTVAGVLLVDDAMEDDVTAQPNAGTRQEGECHDASHDAALHVRRAAAVHSIVFDFRAVRVFRPLAHRLDGHGVDVTVQDQRSAATGALDDTHDIGSSVIIENRLQPAFSEGV